MKTTTPTLRHLFVTVAAIAAAILPANVFAAPGDLFVSDWSTGTIFKFTPDGTKTTFASELAGPSGLAFDASGNLFVNDATGLNATIFKFAPDGTRSIFAHTGLYGGGSLAFDASGNLFVADDPSGTILKFTPSGTRSIFASGLNIPIGLAFDISGNLFVVDHGSATIFKFTPAGTKTTFAGGLSSPWGLAFSASGDLFEVSNSDGAIYVITADGTHGSIFASGLDRPTFLAFDAAGNLFVANYGSGTISKFTPAGTKTTFASGVASPQGMAFEPAIPTPDAALMNISTRALSQTGENVLIGGFVIGGTVPKQVLIRAIGPSLAKFGVAESLQDPTVSLFQGITQITSNDDWQSASNSGQIPLNLQPTDSRESAILITLQPGAYTAIVSGKGGTIGTGLVEVYDLNPSSSSQLINISARGAVQTGDNVMIGGFIASGSTQVIVRGLGPTLAQFGVSGALADPVVTLVDGNGNVVQTNDNWKNTQQAAIQTTGLAPPNDLEAAINATVAPGNYTAILSGDGGGTGIGLVEVYKL